MILEEALKNSYENLGFAVLDVTQVPGTPLFEVEFIGEDGPFKRKICTLFAMVYEPPTMEDTCNLS